MGEEGDGLEARFRLRGAAGKSGIIREAVVVNEITEGEAVAEKYRFARRGGEHRLIFRVEGGKFFLICRGVLAIRFGMRGVGALQCVFNGVAEDGGIFQRQPDMLVVLVLVVFMLMLFGHRVMVVGLVGGVMIVVMLLVGIVVISLSRVVIVVLMAVAVVMIMVMVMVFVLFHTLDVFLRTGAIPHDVHEIDDNHIFIRRRFQRVLYPFVRFAADVNEYVAVRDLQNILGGRLVAVQIDAFVEQHRQFDMALFVADDFPRPVIDRENRSDNGKLRRFFLVLGGRLPAAAGQGKHRQQR